MLASLTVVPDNVVKDSVTRHNGKTAGGNCYFIPMKDDSPRRSIAGAAAASRFSKGSVALSMANSFAR